MSKVIARAVDTRSVRIYLAVPGNRPQDFAAAYEAGADAVVFDLDKPVPEAEKDAARQAVAAFVARPLPLPTVVRINGPDTAHTARDLAAVVGIGLTALRLPRVESADWIRDVARRVDARRVAHGIVAEIGLEIYPGTSSGLRCVDELAQATHTIWRLGLGEESLYGELGSSADSALLLARLQVVQAARVAGLPGPVQKSFLPHWTNADLRTSSWLGAELGYTARTVWSAEHVAILKEVQADFLQSPIRTASGVRPARSWQE